MYRSNGTLAQKWKLVGTAKSGFVLVSALSDKLCLDVAGGSPADGTNIRLWNRNGSNAKKFWAISTSGVTGSQKASIADGAYTIDIAGYALDAAGGSAAKGANVQAQKRSGSMGQKWYLTYHGGYYTISNVVTVGADGSVRLADRGAGKSQLMALAPCDLLEDGFYTITMGSLALDVKGAGTKKGVNIDAYRRNGSVAQVFSISRNADGTYTVINDISGMALDVAGASKAEGANVQQWRSNGSAAQKWRIAWRDGGFEFTNVATGRKLSTMANAASGANVTSSSGGSTKWLLQEAAPITTSGDADLDRIAQSLMDRYGTGERGLRNVYQYIVDNYSYSHGNTYPGGNWTSWAKPYAKEMYWNGNGNCYRFISLFVWAARRMGFSAQAISGEVLSRKGWEAHGWVTINHVGKELCYDLTFYQTYRREGFFGSKFDGMPVYCRFID